MPKRSRVIFSKIERVMNRLIAFVVVIGVMAASARAQVSAVTVLTPRLFGHFVGDVLTDEVDVRVVDGTELDMASVPQPGFLNQWLELVGSRVDMVSDRGGKLYRLHLSYQTFYPALDARQLAVPGFTLTLKSGAHIYPAPVPAWSFGISPLREVLPPARASGGQYMQPNIVPAYYDTRDEAYRALRLAGVGLIALALLAYHLAWWPFARRRRRPFARAARVIRKALASGDMQSGYREALIALHRALDQTAGQSILSADAPEFFAQHPAFARMQDEFTRFFASSQSVFFGDNPAGALASFGSLDLRRFSEALVVAERSAP
jgi:mxaA protein